MSNREVSYKNPGPILGLIADRGFDIAYAQIQWPGLLITGKDSEVGFVRTQ
jgi:hypothetical protein